jgi:hypothetical protein
MLRRRELCVDQHIRAGGITLYQRNITNMDLQTNRTRSTEEWCEGDQIMRDESKPDQPEQPPPVQHLYLMYHTKSGRIVVRRSYNHIDLLGWLWKTLQKQRGPFGPWNVVVLSDEGLRINEWVCSISEHCLGDPVQLTSQYLDAE